MRQACRVMSCHVVSCRVASCHTVDDQLVLRTDSTLSGSDGTTPLCAAALWGNDVMVGFLLDKGADVSARNEGSMLPLY